VSLGSDFERRVMAKLKEHGWYVMRAAGSRGVADLVAMRQRDPVRLGPEVLLVQCKRGFQCGPKEWNALVSAAEQVCAVPVLAAKVKRGVIGFWRMTGRKTGRKGVKAPIEELVL